MKRYRVDGRGTEDSSWEHYEIAQARVQGYGARKSRTRVWERLRECDELGPPVFFLTRQQQHVYLYNTMDIHLIVFLWFNCVLVCVHVHVLFNMLFILCTVPHLGLFDDDCWLDVTSLITYFISGYGAVDGTFFPPGTGRDYGGFSADRLSYLQVY